MLSPDVISMSMNNEFTKKVNLRQASFDFGFTSLWSHAISPDLVHIDMFSLLHALRISYTDVFVGDKFQAY